MGLGRQHGARPDALVPDEFRVVIEPPAVPVGVQLADEETARILAVHSPRGQQWLERSLLGGRQVGTVCVPTLEQDIEVAHRPESSRHLAQVDAMSTRPSVSERIAEDAPRGALAARRDAHRVEFLEIGTLARPCLAGDHPREVEAEDLSARLGARVVEEDAGRLPDGQPRPFEVAVGRRGTLRA
jgi:hypothetical protein